MPRQIDATTKDWIRTAADEWAARAGMVFDAERGKFVCDWVEANCCLYEGEQAGQPMRLYPAQRDWFMRLYSWIRWSDEWGCWVRRFTRAASWKSKKNGKSPEAAAHNLYLCSADGEQGQKVYMMASEGKQARIAQMHAINMVAQSPALREDCKVNRTTLDVTHLPTNSKIEVVTGNDRRGASGKHGYNGSVTIDEMHVVSRPMMDAVGRAGISRKEPLQVSFSTAGTDPSSAGFERCQYGRQVNSGQRQDLHYLHVEYTAGDALTDAEIDADLDRYGKLANPAWGTLIKPSEFRADWAASKGDQRKVALFKQERLNMWVGSVTPWLDAAAWDRGRRAYTLADLAGRECYGGLDLSRTRDMTAFALIFPWPEDGPEALRLWPMFWLPADRAAELDHLFPYRSWADAGHLTLTPGNVVDYGLVKADVRAAVTAHALKLLGLYFDPHYAEELTQHLADGETAGGGHVPGLGCERKAVAQTLMVLSPLCKEFERRLVGGHVQHPGNDVMTWQVSHAQVWTDRNQNVRPVKPTPTSGKSVDGVMATIDAMAGPADPDAPRVTFINPCPVVM